MNITRCSACHKPIKPEDFIAEKCARNPSGHVLEAATLQTLIVLSMPRRNY
jgi:hypothetical protein